MKDMATAVIFSNQFSEAVIRNTSLKISLLKNPPKNTTTFKSKKL